MWPESPERSTPSATYAKPKPTTHSAAHSTNSITRRHVLRRRHILRPGWRAPVGGRSGLGRGASSGTVWESRDQGGGAHGEEGAAGGGGGRVSAAAGSPTRDRGKAARLQRRTHLHTHRALLLGASVTRERRPTRSAARVGGGAYAMCGEKATFEPDDGILPFAIAPSSSRPGLGSSEPPPCMSTELPTDACVCVLWRGSRCSCGSSSAVVVVVWCSMDISDSRRDISDLRTSSRTPSCRSTTCRTSSAAAHASRMKPNIAFRLA